MDCRMIEEVTQIGARLDCGNESLQQPVIEISLIYKLWLAA